MYYMVEDPTTGYNTGLAEKKGGKIVTNLIYVHRSEHCAGHHCYIHNTSSVHPLSMEPALWSDEDMYVYRECIHGLAHPDRDNEQYHLSQGSDRVTHECDGCCKDGGYIWMKANNE